MAEGSKNSVGAWVATAVLAVGAAGAATWAVPAFQESQDLKDGAESAFSASATDPSSSAVADATGEASSSASASATGQPVDAQALSSKLTDLANGYSSGNVTMLVTDQVTGETLFNRGGDDARMPASNFKILTDYTLMRVMNPSDRFTTKIVGQDKNLTLVAGGDTLLGTGESKDDLTVGHAGLKTLTQKTFDALVKEGASDQYTVNLDTSIFPSDSLNSAWAQEDIDAGFVTAVRPLAFYSHYSPGDDGRSTQDRPKDAAAQVQQSAIDQLNALGKDKGITFVAGDEAKADSSATELASVESATVAEQAAYMMTESDNMLAETLARNAAVANGSEGTVSGGKDTILSVLKQDGVNTDKLTISDFSGLSTEDRVTSRTLLDLTNRIVEGQKGEDAALDGFPVAGGTGTLAERFNDDSEKAAQGFARAKTGTLNSVIAMTGYTTTESGRLVLFSIITNDVTDADAAKNLLDQSVSIITQS